MAVVTTKANKLPRTGININNTPYIAPNTAAQITSGIVKALPLNNGAIELYY